MAKKNYRKNPIEKQQHDTAVKVRKMTDEQLCNFLDEVAAENTNKVKEFLEKLQNLKGTGNGIGENIIAKLYKIAEIQGFIGEETE